MPPLAAVPDLEHELDVLFGLPLDRFTKARNDLAARLKRAHQDDAAAEVRALRKPSIVAGAANTLARSEPKLVAALLAAGDQLRDAQQRALAGKARPEEVNGAAEAERAALRDLLAAARALLTSPSTLDRLAQTLRAAAVDPAARTLLERGRLTDELDAVGFGPLEAVKPARRRDDGECRAARERIKELRAEARRLATEARDAETAAHDASRVAAELAEAAEAARADAERAATELAEAEERAPA